MRRGCLTALVFLSGLIAAMTISPAFAQGVLVASRPELAHRLPRPIPQPRVGEPGVLYDIARLEIDASIRNQVAEVQVGQTFKNRTSRTLQVRFVFPLPYQGAIDQMTFMVDGQELEGRLLEVDKAREIYQSYVRRSRDPALVQWIGTGMFQTEVFPVPPGAERTVSLRYTQLVRRRGSLNDWLLPLSPAKYTCTPIGEVAIRGRIRSNSPLGNVYSPSHDVEIDRDGQQVARFEFIAKNHVPDSDFRLMWDAGEDPVQMSLVSYRPDPDQDGYFMLMIQPQFPDAAEGSPSSDRLGKNVVLVLDRSGSMRGEKIDQARRAARRIVERLRRRDHFNVITYDSKVETFRSDLAAADKVTRGDAVEYIDSMLAGGSTNIDGALSEALEIAGRADGPVYVMFMTDGQPTVGEKNTMKIVANAEDNLHEGTRLFSLGVGHDVNSRLLDKLASICLGQTSYVRPGAALDDAIETLWSRIGAPALTDAKLKILVDGKEGRTSQLYPEMYDLFSGDQLVIVGRYRKPGNVMIELRGDYLGKQESFEFEDELPRQTGSGKDVFVERLWATRRIGQIIDEIDLHGESDELVDELIVLSKRHGILTPYTAYLAEERTDLNDMREGRRVARSQLRALGLETGEEAFEQRDFKGQLKLADRAAPAGGAGGMNAPQDSFSLDGITAGGLRESLNRGSAIRSSGRPLTAALDETLIQHASADPVKRIGSKTFFLRNGRYIDSDATAKQVESAIEITQFSDAYFDLLEKLDETDRAYLAEDRELVVRLNHQTYRIMNAKE